MTSAKTPNAALNLIPFDQEPWDEDANENTSIIDGILGQFFSIPNFVGVWKNTTNYAVPQTVIDAVDGSQWVCNISHVSANSPTLFSADRTANPTYWSSVGASSAANAASAAASAASAANSAAQQGQNTGRNLVLNSTFRIAQRGPGPFTVLGQYTLDRWLPQGSADAINIQQGVVSDVARTAIGDESVNTVLVNIFTGNAAASSYNAIVQHMETVRSTAGKTVVVSFWANAGVAGLKLGVNIAQNFGTGGSPSAAVSALLTGFAATLTTTYTRYFVTIAVPSVNGKVFGTNNDAFSSLQFWFSSGATNNAIAGNIGVQAGQINIWGVQLEIGSVATLLEKPYPGAELDACLRHYQSSTIKLDGYQVTAGTFGASQSLIVPMRALPTISSLTWTVQSNCAGGMLVLDPRTVQPFATITATGVFQVRGVYALSAEL